MSVTHVDKNQSGRRAAGRGAPDLNMKEKKKERKTHSGLLFSFAAQDLIGQSLKTLEFHAKKKASQAPVTSPPRIV